MSRKTIKKIENVILKMISSHNKQLEFLGFCVKVKPVQIILGHNGLKLLLKLKCSYLNT